jgi:PhnB protein
VDTVLSATPFLLFDGNCAEAMTFYQQCLGGDLTLTKLSETPMKEMFPPEKHDRIINAHLKSGDLAISATDWMASPEFDPVMGNMSAVFVESADLDQLTAAFDKLARDADREHFQELHPMPFGIYGQLFDRYGVQWIFRGDSN